MSIETREDEIQRRLSGLLDDPSLKRGIEVMANDPFFLAFFLVSVSQGEGLGAAAVGVIGQEEIAWRLHELQKQEQEEHEHRERTLEAAQRLFPDYFDDGRYRWDQSLQGMPYYLAVLESNKQRLKRLGRYSRLNQYLTTTFGYEVMVLLLYRAVSRAMAGSSLPQRTRDDVAALLNGILDEEETHVGILDEHNALLGGDREGLSTEACAALDELGQLTGDDYEFAAQLAVRQLLAMMESFAQPEAYRAAIEAGTTGGR